MILFSKDYVRRRFEIVEKRGADTCTSSDTIVSADIQRVSMKGSPLAQGNRQDIDLKAWTDDPFRTDDQIAGTVADWIWKEGAWYRCKSCQRSNNTILDHYVSEFARVSEAARGENIAPPEVLPK